MFQTIYQKIQKFFEQPTTVSLSIEPPITLDLSAYQHSLGWFFEYGRAHSETDPIWKNFPYKGIVHLYVNKEPKELDWSKTKIIVIFFKNEISIETIQSNLKKIGIHTKLS